MVVSRNLLLTAGLALLAVGAQAQDAYVRVWVDEPVQSVDRAFWIFVEASGQQVETPQIPEVEGLIINTRNPQSSRQFKIRPGRAEQSIRLAYNATPIKPGVITIPEITVVIDGREMKSEPIEVTVEGVVTQTPQSRAEVRLYVDNENVTRGVPFWLYIEASGGDIVIPDKIAIDGLRVDTVNVMRSVSSRVGSGQTRMTRKHGYHCTALDLGTVTVPPIEVVVDGQTIETEPITLTVTATPPKESVKVTDPSNQDELTKEDLVFINMEVDKAEVYQGEPLVLRTQLWRIIHRSIQSGPYRGSLITPPSTEGFYVNYLDPVTYTAKRGGLDYEVSEERKILYPTAIGDLRIGQWHWEGVALLFRHNIVEKRRLLYSLNAGPIKIDVKPLPPRPTGFNGAVGQFDIEARLDDEQLTRGVPTNLTISVSGVGNPDAVGDPSWPVIDWAHISEPERSVENITNSQSDIPSMLKSFSYRITPLDSGRLTIPPVDFIFFDPEEGEYVTRTAGPYDVVVQAGDEETQHIVVAGNPQSEGSSVEILAEDIRPIEQRPARLQRHQPTWIAGAAAALAPVVAYAFVGFFAMRRRRFSKDIGFARAYHAKSRGLGALKSLDPKQAPADALYRALVEFIGDRYNVDGAGMTSSDAERVMRENNVDSAIVEKGVRALRACERVSYASQEVSAEEVRALMDAAEEFVHDLSTSNRRKR